MNEFAMGRRQFVAAAAGIAAALPIAAGLGRLALAEEEEEVEEVDEEAIEEEASEVAPYEPQPTVYPYTVTLVDGDGNEFEQTYEAAPASAITLNDSSAEILCRLGLASKVIGTVTPDADMPEEIAEDYATIEQIGDKKTLSREVIVGMGPEIVVSRALSFTADGLTDAESYNDLGIQIYSQLASAAKGNPTLQGVIEDIKNIAAIFDVQEAAADLVNDLQDRLASIEEQVAERLEEGAEAQSVLLMIGLSEGTFGTVGGQLGASLPFNIVEMMGGTLASTSSASGLTYENLIQFNPDVILYVTATRNAETDAVALDTLYAEETLASVPAVANGRIVEIPYADFIDYSPRVFDAAEAVLEVLYPQD